MTPLHRMYGDYQEDRTRCARGIYGKWTTTQCSRPRGHGEGGEYCKQHAAKGEAWQKPGGWERRQLTNALDIIAREEKLIAEAVAKRDHYAKVAQAMRDALTANGQEP